ncbi:uncharacterized protein BX664DRAFT_321648 [Halteromyces radiatus]|uniref:uncharacterized protein n=1 Tax=Halteromyces radiatus TaxID=101107 RepID=UPI0022206AD3|nr:uncharacterized protein BX664DRAFT_321648 [Halteromyces radiatus]KAI8099581.1 hypothetical protein BX664DRAFT_321648 [Halteromyces radiatus]
MDPLPDENESQFSHTNLDTLHNLMNYSMPNSMTSLELPDDIPPPKRQIQHADVHTRLRQLEHDMEQLTLSNVRLLRTNRILKLDCDRLVDEQTEALKKEIQELRRMNVQLQRSNRLLQDDMNIKTEELHSLRADQIRQMKNVGPEYEYLVQMIHLLYRQIDGKSSCDKTCCYTNLPLSQGFSVLTLPPESEEQKPEAQHICRPVIHSNITGGDLASSLEQENGRLRQSLEALQAEQEDLCHLLKEKEDVAEVLKSELRMKDAIVSQLEKDFERMELEVLDLQKDWRYSDRIIKSDPSFSDIHAFPLPPVKEHHHHHHSHNQHQRHHSNSLDDSISISNTVSTTESSPCSPVSEYSLAD